MIISAANRTDIQAFYSEWFINRIREKKVMVRNPYYPDLVTEYRLDPEVVDLLCFCTKNPTPMLIGHVKSTDQIRKAKQSSYIDRQLSLF